MAIQISTGFEPLKQNHYTLAETWAEKDAAAARDIAKINTQQAGEIAQAGMNNATRENIASNQLEAEKLQSSVANDLNQQKIDANIAQNATDNARIDQQNQYQAQKDAADLKQTGLENARIAAQDQQKATEYQQGQADRQQLKDLADKQLTLGKISSSLRTAQWTPNAQNQLETDVTSMVPDFKQLDLYHVPDTKTEQTAQDGVTTYSNTAPKDTRIMARRENPNDTNFTFYQVNKNNEYTALMNKDTNTPMKTSMEAMAELGKVYDAHSSALTGKKTEQGDNNNNRYRYIPASIDDLGNSTPEKVFDNATGTIVDPAAQAKVQEKNAISSDKPIPITSNTEKPGMGDANATNTRLPEKATSALQPSTLSSVAPQVGAMGVPVTELQKPPLVNLDPTTPEGVKNIGLANAARRAAQFAVQQRGTKAATR